MEGERYVQLKLQGWRRWRYAVLSGQRVCFSKRVSVIRGKARSQHLAACSQVVCQFERPANVTLKHRAEGFPAARKSRRPTYITSLLPLGLTLLGDQLWHMRKRGASTNRFKSKLVDE